MICPCCDTINKDDAKKCKNCGIRLTGRRARPEDEEREKSYVKAGVGAVAVIALFLIVVITLSSCICSGCETNAGQEQINDDVGGEYFPEVGSYSDTAPVSTGDSPVSPIDAPAE